MKLFSNTIPLHIQGSFWVLAGIIAWLAGGSPLQYPFQFASWMLIVFASVVVHELGHAIFATLWGQNVQIVLGPLGGTTMYGGGKRALSPIKEFIVVLSGPVFGLLLAACAYVMQLYSSPVFLYFLSSLAFANIIWSLFNLLPVHPFDGGKLMSILFEGLFGATGLSISYILSGIFAVLLATFCFVYYQLFAGALLLLCAFESFKNYRDRRFFQTTATEKDVDLLEEKSQNAEELEAFIQKTKESEVRQEAIFRLAKLYAASDNYEKALSLLASQKRHSDDALTLMQYLFYKLGRYKEAIDAGNRLFRERQDAQAAIINAFCSARLGDIESSVNWLSMVKKAHAVEMRALLSAQDFDSIRNDTRFQRLLG